MTHLFRIFLLLVFSSIFVSASHSQRAPRINVIKTTLGPVDSNFGSGSVASKRPGHTTQLITNTHNNTKDSRFDESRQIQYAQFLVEFNQQVRGVAIIDSRRNIHGGHDSRREGISFQTNAFHFEYFSYENRGYTIDLQPYVLPTRECLENQFSTAQLAAFDARAITTAPALLCDKWIVYGELGTFGPGGTATVPKDRGVIYLRVSPDHTIVSRRGTRLTSLSPLVNGLPHYMFIDNAGSSNDGQASDHYRSGAHLRVIELTRDDNYPRHITTIKAATNDLPAVEYTTDDENTRLVRTRLQWKLSYNRPVLVSSITGSDFRLGRSGISTHNITSNITSDASVDMDVTPIDQANGYARSFIIGADVELPDLLNDIELRYGPYITIEGADHSREHDDVRFHHPNSGRGGVYGETAYISIQDRDGNRVDTNADFESRRYSIAVVDDTPVEFVNYPTPSGVNSPIHRVCPTCTDGSRGYNPNNEKIMASYDGSTQEVFVFEWRMRFSEPIEGRSGTLNNEIDVNDFRVTVNGNYNSAHGISVVSVERHPVSENFDYIITAYSPVAGYGEGNALSDGDILGMSLKSDAYITDNTGTDENRITDTNFAHPFGQADHWTSTYELVTAPFEVVSIERHNSVNQFVPLDGMMSWEVTLSRAYHENTDFDLAGLAFGIRVHDGDDDRWLSYDVFRTTAQKIPGTNTKVRVTVMPYNRTNNRGADRRWYGSTGLIRLVADRYLHLVHNSTGDLFTGIDGARLETPVAPTISETYDLDFVQTTLTGISLVNGSAPQIDADNLSWRVQFSGNIKTDTLPDASNFQLTYNRGSGSSYQPLDNAQLDITGDGDTYTVSVSSLETDLFIGDRVRLALNPNGDIEDAHGHPIVWQNLSSEYGITAASVNERILSDTITATRVSSSEVVFTIVFVTDNPSFDPPASTFTVSRVSDGSEITGTTLEIDESASSGARHVFNLTVPYANTETSELSLNFVADSLVRPNITNITRVSPTTAFAGGTELTWGLTFEDDIDPTTINPEDFALTGTDTDAVITVSRVGTSSTWNIKASDVSVAGDAGEVSLSLASFANITDTSNNAIEEDFDFTTASYTLDALGPTIVSIAPATGLARATHEGLSWTITFSEPVATLSGITISGYDSPPAPTIEAIGTGTSATPTTQWRVTTVSGGTLTGTTASVLPIFTSAIFTDMVGNEQSSRDISTSAATYTYDVDTTMTAGTIVRVGDALSNSSTVDWTLTFDRPVDPATVQPSDFSPTGLLVSGSGTTYTITSAVVSGSSVTLGVASGASFTDTRDAETASPVITSDHETYNYDGDAPTVTALAGISRVNPASDAQKPATTTFTWAITLDSDIDTSTIDASGFAVATTNTGAVTTIEGITRQSNSFTWHVEADVTVLNGEFSLTLATGHSITDIAGNLLQPPSGDLLAAAGYTIDDDGDGDGTNNGDTVPPKILGVVREAPANVHTTNLLTYTWAVEFDADIDPLTINQEDFVVTGASSNTFTITDLTRPNANPVSFIWHVTSTVTATSVEAFQLGLASGHTISDTSGNPLTTPSQSIFSAVNFTYDPSAGGANSPTHEISYFPNPTNLVLHTTSLLTRPALEVISIIRTNASARDGGSPSLTNKAMKSWLVTLNQEYEDSGTFFFTNGFDPDDSFTITQVPDRPNQVTVDYTTPNPDDVPSFLRSRISSTTELFVIDRPNRRNLTVTGNVNEATYVNDNTAPTILRVIRDLPDQHLRAPNGGGQTELQYSVYFSESVDPTTVSHTDFGIVNALGASIPNATITMPTRAGASSLSTIERSNLNSQSGRSYQVDVALPNDYAGVAVLVLKSNSGVRDYADNEALASTSQAPHEEGGDYHIIDTSPISLVGITKVFDDSYIASSMLAWRFEFNRAVATPDAADFITTITGDRNVDDLEYIIKPLIEGSDTPTTADTARVWQVQVYSPSLSDRNRHNTYDLEARIALSDTATIQDIFNEQLDASTASSMTSEIYDVLRFAGTIYVGGVELVRAVRTNPLEDSTLTEEELATTSFAIQDEFDDERTNLLFQLVFSTEMDPNSVTIQDLNFFNIDESSVYLGSRRLLDSGHHVFRFFGNHTAAHGDYASITLAADGEFRAINPYELKGFGFTPVHESFVTSGDSPLVGVWTISTEAPFVRSVEAFWHKASEDCSNPFDCDEIQHTNRPNQNFLPIESGDYITWSINFNDDLSSTASFQSTIDASDFIVVGDGGPLRNVELTVTQDPDAYSYYPNRCENPENCWDVRAKIDTSHNNFQDNRFQYGNLYELRLSGTSDIANRFGERITTLTPSSPTSTNELRVRVDSEAPRLNAFDTYDQSTNRAYTGSISSLRPRWRFVFNEPVQSSTGGYAITADNITLGQGVPPETQIIVSPPRGHRGIEYYLALQLPDGFNGNADIDFTVDLSDIYDTAGNQYNRAGRGRCGCFTVDSNYMTTAESVTIDRNPPEILGVTASGETGTGSAVVTRGTGADMVYDVAIDNNIVYNVYLSRRLHSDSDAKLTISNSDGRTKTTSTDNLVCANDPCAQVAIPNTTPVVMGYPYSVTVPVTQDTSVGMQTVTISSPTYDEYGNLINPDGDTYVPTGVFVHDTRPFTVIDIVRGYHSSNIVEINNLFVSGFNGALTPREEHATTATWRIRLSEAIEEVDLWRGLALGDNVTDGLELVVTNPDGTPFDYASNPGTFPPTLTQFFCYGRSCSAVADLRPLYFNHDFNISIRFTDSLRLRRASIPADILDLTKNPNTPSSIIDLAYLQVPNSDSGTQFDPENFKYEVNNSSGTQALGTNVSKPLLVASVAKNPTVPRASLECEIFRECATTTTSTTTNIAGSAVSSSGVERVASGDVLSISVASVHGNLAGPPSSIVISGVENPDGGRWVAAEGNDVDDPARGYRYEFTVTDIFPFHDGPLEVSIGGYRTDGSLTNGDVLEFDTLQGSYNPNDESIAIGSFEIVRPLQLLRVSTAEPNATPSTIAPATIPDTSVDPFSVPQQSEPTTEYRAASLPSFLWRIRFNRQVRSIFAGMFVVSSAQSFPPDEPDEPEQPDERIESGGGVINPGSGQSSRCVRFECGRLEFLSPPQSSPALASPAFSPSASPTMPQFTNMPPPVPAMSSFAPLPVSSHTVTAMADPNDPTAVLVTVTLTDPTATPDHTTLMVGLSQQAPIQDFQGNFPTTTNVGQQLITIVQALPSTVNPGDLVGNRNIIDHTYELVSSFIERRADQILSNIPDLSDRLNRGVIGGFTRTNNFTASVDESGSNIDFDGVYRLDMSDIFKVEDTEGWLETDYSSIEGDDGAATSTFFVKGGIDYSIQENIIAGLLLMLDWASEDGGNTPLDRHLVPAEITALPDVTGATAPSEIEGMGWLAGPYIVADFDPNVQFEGKLAWGGSSNSIKPFGTYEADFESSRFLLAAGLSSSGYSSASGWSISPAIDYLYYQEEVDEFRDNAPATPIASTQNIPATGNLIPSIEYGVHRVEFGPTFSKASDISSGKFNTVFGVTGVWSSGESESNGAAQDVEDFNARINLRFDYLGDSGINLNFGGYYGGLGGDYSSYGLTVGVTTKF